MFLEVLAMIRTLASLGTPYKILSDWSEKSEGDTRALLDEIKQNLRFCTLVIDDGIPIEKVIKEIKTKEYDRLLKHRHDFNTLQKKKIVIPASYKRRDIQSWNGKKTQDLVINIYDKLKEIRTSYPHTSASSKRRWNVRVSNVYLRMLLLIKHKAN